MVVLRLLLISMLCWWAVPAQSQAAPPTGTTLSQEQFDALAEAVSRTVVQKLKEDGFVAKEPDRTLQAAPVENSLFADEAVVASYFRRMGEILGDLPVFLDSIGQLPQRLSPSDGGSRPFGLYLGLLVLSAAAALFVEALARLALGPLRRRIVAGRVNASGTGAPGSWPAIAVSASDGAALLALWIAAYGISAALFHEDMPQDRIAVFVMAGVFSWRLYMLAFRIAFRPVLSEVRLAEIGDRDAKAIFSGVSVAIVIIILLRILMRSLMQTGAVPSAIACGQLVAAIVVVATFLATAFALRAPVERWLLGLARHPTAIALARHWLVLAVPLFLIFAIAQIYGAIAHRPAVPSALILTLNVIIALLLVATAIRGLSRLGLDPTAPDATPALRLRDPIMKGLRTAFYLCAGYIVARVWVLDVLTSGDNASANDLLRSVLVAVVTLFIAYCAWIAISFATTRHHTSRGDVDSASPSEDGEAEGHAGASRLSTLMPLVRVAMLVVICVLAVLTVLAQFGVNVTALVAGASVVGLAISFGSQTLVKDIVSGVFYLVDDAFRVGEYIDCGKAKGTVEGFTLRSLRLRHQSGQVHTIPFGQLGQITNFSRDWTTAKFNLRFVRNTDLEVLRKATKKIGLEMMEDPELKDEILLPLKMQGVADIDDYALVVRFKFTVKPNKPTFVQREALKRMFREFPAAGIEFANAMVSVNSMTTAATAATDDAARAGAAGAHLRLVREAARKKLTDAEEDG